MAEVDPSDSGPGKVTIDEIDVWQALLTREAPPRRVSSLSWVWGHRLQRVGHSIQAAIRLALNIYVFYLTLACSENAVNLARQMQIGPCIPVETQR